MTDENATFEQLITAAATQLAALSDSPRLDAELLLACAIDRPRSHLRAWPESRPDPAQNAQFEKLLARRLAGEPMAHIFGVREFWSLDLKVTADTLIPRPDTEILVETALEKIPRSGACRVLDLGTGTGAIALAVKQERPLAEVHASDASDAALAVARENAARHALDIRFHHGDWWTPFTGAAFDVVVSNPPYIAENDAHLERGDVRFEPRTALAAGKDGLDDIRRIVSGARTHLAPGGWLLLEHGHDQAQAVADLLRAAGFRETACRRDLAGNDRVSLARKPADGDAA